MLLVVSTWLPALAAADTGATAVTTLTDANFDKEVLGNTQLWVVDFYAPWCAHCQVLAPHFEAAAGRLAGIVAFGKVDCTAQQALAQRFAIQSYPSLRTFGPGSVPATQPEEFETGEGDAGDIVRAALAELSMIVLDRTRKESTTAGGDASAAADAGSAQTCQTHVDPDSGIEVEVCNSDGQPETIGSQVRQLPATVDVAIVGGGPAGLGTAIAMKDAGIDDTIILEQGAVGETFRKWPQEMRFVSPSFYSNPFKVPDLNAVNPHSSPAFVLNAGHPSGANYAEYLEMLADYYNLNVHENTGVASITPSTRELPSSLGDGNTTYSGFDVVTASGATIFSRYVVWAGGEFQFPKQPLFPGAELGLHSSKVYSWANFTSTVTADRGSMVVVGGYESGIDAAVNLVDSGVQNVFVFDKHAHWENRQGEPSELLSPRTIERLDRALAAQAHGGGKIHTLKQRVAKIVDTLPATGEVDSDTEEAAEPSSGRYRVYADDGAIYYTNTPPILGTGFKGNSSVVADMFGWDEATDYPTLTANDEAVKTPGLFLVGPAVRHRLKEDTWIFCFIYKYRSRFPVVAKAIAERLGRNHKKLADWRSHNMFMDELNPSAACACKGKS